MVSNDQFWYIDRDSRGDIKHQVEEDELFENIQMAQYEDTTKLYDIINHYTDDEILTVEISHDTECPVFTVTSTEQDKDFIQTNLENSCT